jgi:hypothetical protein
MEENLQDISKHMLTMRKPWPFLLWGSQHILAKPFLLYFLKWLQMIIIVIVIFTCIHYLIVRKKFKKSFY